MLALRYWKEAHAGMGDSVGVAELGKLVYTKAIPDEVLRILGPYSWTVPW